MSVFNNWTTDQWNAFAGFTVAGLAALALLALSLAAVRRRRVEHREVAELIAAWRATPSHTVAIVAGPMPRELPLPVVDPTGAVLEHLAPGPGSLTDLAVAEGSLTRVEQSDLIDPEVSAWFDAMAERWQRSVDTALAPAMLVAVTWAIEGAAAGVAGRVAADAWRADCPTGEYPLVPVREAW